MIIIKGLMCAEVGPWHGEVWCLVTNSAACACWSALNWQLCTEMGPGANAGLYWACRARPYWTCLSSSTPDACLSKLLKFFPMT